MKILSKLTVRVLEEHKLYDSYVSFKKQFQGSSSIAVQRIKFSLSSAVGGDSIEVILQLISVGVLTTREEQNWQTMFVN